MNRKGKDKRRHSESRSPDFLADLLLILVEKNPKEIIKVRHNDMKIEKDAIFKLVPVFIDVKNW